MDQAHLLVPHELQLNQLPEGTEIQVPRLPLACAYKRQGVKWSPIESIPTVYKPLILDEFPLGSIATDPEGIIYVKGSGGCQTHLGLGHPCQCTKPLCWLRIGPCPAPHPPGSAPVHVTLSDRDIAMEDPGEGLDFQNNVQHVKPDMPTIEVGQNGHGPRSHIFTSGDYTQLTENGNFGASAMTGTDRPTFSVTNGSEDVRHVSRMPMAANGGIQLPSQPVPVNRLEDGTQLQELHQPGLGSDSCTIYFGQQNNGISLTAIDAVDDKVFSFERGSTLGVKASFRFKFKYWQDIPELKEYVDRRKQVTIRHGGDKHGAPISLRAMASLVHSELMAEMKTMAGFERPLLHGGLLVRMEELVLLRIERITTGTLQPVFMLRR